MAFCKRKKNPALQVKRQHEISEKSQLSEAALGAEIELRRSGRQIEQRSSAQRGKRDIRGHLVIYFLRFYIATKWMRCEETAGKTQFITGLHNG